MNRYILLILMLIFTGCSVKEKIIYQNTPVSKPAEKPKFEPYELNIININGTEFYAFQKSEANIIAGNWISYKNWCEANYKILNQMHLNYINNINNKKQKEIK